MSTHTIEGHEDKIVSLAWDGVYVVSASYDGTLGVWGQH